MSSATIASLAFASQQIYIWAGIPIFILGLIGDSLNILVFLSLKTFRESSCAFYLTIMSFVNLGQLTTSLLTRIIISSFNIDWTKTSLVYCKCRIFLIQTTSFISFACFCLATIDQYFATCTRPRWQQWCNIKTAWRLLTIISLLLIINQIPLLIYSEHVVTSTTNQTTCAITNTFLVLYNTYFNYLTLLNFGFYVITFSFGVMAYRNVQQLAYRTVPLVRRELDKQLTTMVLVQVVYNFVTLIPYLIMYLIITQGNIQDSLIRAQLNVASTISSCLYYLCFASAFYIYMIVSERFRRQLIYVIFQVHYNYFCRKQRMHADQPVAQA